MTATHDAGPYVAFGQLASGTGGDNPEAGPSLFYQGIAVPDSRLPYAPGVTGIGKLFGVQESGIFIGSDQIPATLTTTKLAAAAAPVAGVAAALVSVAAYGVTPKMQLCPMFAGRNAGSVVSNLIGIDIGFGSVSITTGLKACTALLTYGLGGTGLMYVGMPIGIAGAGSSGAPLFTRVATITGPTTFTVADAAITTVVAAPIFNADDGLVTYDPWRTVGAAKLIDPYQGAGRCITLVSAAGAGGAWNLVGYDVYNKKINETMTKQAGATTDISAKAYKFLLSATPAYSDAGTVSIGTSDVFGFGLRVDNFANARIFMADAPIVAAAGFVAGVATDPATAITGDPRGRYTVQTASNGTAVDTGRRLQLSATPPPSAFWGATPANGGKTLFGVPHFSI